jgi:hypothetical protein
MRDGALAVLCVIVAVTVAVLFAGVWLVAPVIPS